MNLENLFPIIFFGILAVVVGSFAVKIFKHGGLKAAFFGAPIERTVGEVTGTRARLMNVVLKVHTLEGGSPDKAIGLEFVAKSFASYQMIPVTLSVSEAKKLETLLQSAIAGRLET